MLIVSDLKQYAYCPRIVYYRYCLPAIRPITYKMEQGRESQGDEEDRERRRSLRTYGLTEGERYFNLDVTSEALGLRGRIDLAIRCPTEAIAVEYKDSPGRTGPHILLQLATYGVLLEEAWGVPARRGFIYFIPARRAREVALTTALRGEVERVRLAIQTMIRTEAMPAPPSQRAKCEICEFRRFCNDVV
ncbi:MAG: CRISPR-associated protein Cas4 [Anaerolineae bacterium]